MNNFKFYFILSLITVTLFSCDKNDDAKVTPPRDYSEQYVTDSIAIETYLKTHAIEKIMLDGLVDVKVTKIPDTNPNGLVSIWDNTEFPLKYKYVMNDGRVSNLTTGRVEDPVKYRMYYLSINEGALPGPVTVDSTLTSYRGWKLDNVEFDRGVAPLWSTFPVMTAAESSVISGYRQFLPLLKAADGFTSGPDGITFTNSGIGVVFLPSGLGYFNTSRTGLPAYSPLVFTVRLHKVVKRDHDRDGVMDADEDINNDNDFYNDDTDGDTIPDFLDVDDDGDGYLTIGEIKRDDNIEVNYPFAEIPTCSGSTTGLKRHRDPACHRPTN